MKELLTDPSLPRGRGELSSRIVGALGGDGRPLPDEAAVLRADPYGDDLQLALYVCYELHYRGFVGVAQSWEWDPGLLGLRAAMEHRFLAALRSDVPRRDSVEDALAEILVDPVDGAGASYFLHDGGELWQLREYVVQRSLYHLKEADPHAWVIPRLTGRAKAAMVAVEFDEFGGGHPERAHARLFADLMEDLDLDPAYGRYLDAGSAEVLATVNLMSLLALHRGLRGALVGHFAALEINSSPPSRRLAQALERVGAGPAAVFFYTEHVEADAVHEQIARHDIIGGLLEAEPGLTTDVVFGIDVTGFLEDRVSEQLLGAWRKGGSSLRVGL